MCPATRDLLPVPAVGQGMKKRSMLAVASLAAGVVASLTAPSAHAEAAGEGTGHRAAPSILTAGTLPGLVDGGKGGDTPHDFAPSHPDRPHR